MRRFSQRNSLVTLSDINITPLLDLAFVLLIIFVITTPLLEQSLNLNLPTGVAPDNRRIDPRNVRRIEVNPQGFYFLNGQRMDLKPMINALANEYRHNPKMVVDIRCDETSPYKFVFAITDQLTAAGVENVALRSKPPPR